MNDRVELLVDARATVGEGPVWDERIGRLYWVDILAGLVHRTDPATGADETFPVGRSVGAVALREDGSLVAAVEDGFGLLHPATGAFELIVSVGADDPSTRMNDGKVDPAGRFWAGTMAFDAHTGRGELYRLDPDLTVTRMLSGVTISNGLDWTADGRTMYYIDTPTGSVDRFDFDLKPGAISGRRPAVVIPPSAGWPDGMALDAEGYLWVALWEGWAVQRYVADGRLDRRIELPAEQVTSVAFGGPDLDELFITTGREGFPANGKPNQPQAGGLFRCRPGVRGRPAHRFRG